MLAGDPYQGGATWAVLQYVLGLRQLGHDVVVVDPVPGPVSAAARSYFDALCAPFQLHGCAAIVPATGAPHGMSEDALRASLRRSTVLLNLSGRWRDDEAVA